MLIVAVHDVAPSTLAHVRWLLARLDDAGRLHGEWIATSPRRLHRGPLRIGMFTMLGRWALGHLGIGRRWPY